MSRRRAVAVAIFVLGCAKGLQPAAPLDEPATVLEMARARPVPLVARVRFHFSIASETLDLAASTGAGLVIARPGRGRMDVFGPFGTPVLTFASDGTEVEALLARERRHLRSEAAEEVFRGLSRGAAGTDDVLALLQGDLPLDGAPVRTIKRREGGSVEVTLDGPEGTSVRALLDPASGTPSEIRAFDEDEALMLLATYSDWAPMREGGPLMPGALALSLPAADLVLELAFREWVALDAPPDAFDLAVPEGFASESLEELFRTLGPPPAAGVPEAPPSVPEPPTGERR